MLIQDISRSFLSHHCTKLGLTHHISWKPSASKTANWANGFMVMFSSKFYIICFEKCKIVKVGQTRTTRMPAFWGYPTPPHDYPYHWVILDPKSKENKVKVTNLKNSSKFQIFEYRNGHYTRHTFWSCLIRCANMKWIRWVLLKIQSGHDSVHRRTDGRTSSENLISAAMKQAAPHTCFFFLVFFI